jgi:signal-transduction protein with cAMP-binding, CBS, and nucleotidyltransferase domain
VREGEVSCRREDGTESAVLHAGDIFGESSLEREGAVRVRDCVGVGHDVSCLRLNADVFHEQLGDLTQIV